RLDTPLGAMTIASTHLSFVPGWNRHQLRQLARTVRALPGPHIIAGDLNMEPGPAVRWSGMRSLACAATFPADAPAQQLDHLLTDDRQLTALRHTTPQVELSDHRPLAVTVTRH
ncbi:MAG: endonuclease, partial [Mycobacterium sp.]